MKLYIAKGTCSRAVQLVANELNLEPSLIHVDLRSKTTSNNEDFNCVNPLGYVPAVKLADVQCPLLLLETTVILTYLADKHPQSELIPASGTVERVIHDQLLAFTATEITLRHAPLMRKITTAEGTVWARQKLLSAYAHLDDRLSDGRCFITGDTFTVADAYVWATMWHTRSGVRIEDLENLGAYITRIERRPSAQKALREEAELAAHHQASLAAD